MVYLHGRVLRLTLSIAFRNEKVVEVKEFARISAANKTRFIRFALSVQSWMRDADKGMNEE